MYNFLLGLLHCCSLPSTFAALLYSFPFRFVELLYSLTSAFAALLYAFLFMCVALLYSFPSGFAVHFRFGFVLHFSVGVCGTVVHFPCTLFWCSV